MAELDVKKKIIKTSSEMFLSHGYSKISMDDIATALKMSKKTLYKNFASKEILLCECIEIFWQEMSKQVEELMKENNNFKTKAKAVFTFVATKLSALNSFFIDDIMKNAPQAWKKIQTIKEESAFRRFNNLLDEGVKNGVFKKSFNKSLTVILYASAIETIINPNFTRQIPHEFIPDLPYSVTAIFEGLVNIIFEGIIKNS